MKLKCKNFGLLTNTEVEDEDGRMLVTNGLDIQTLVALWRWYFRISYWERIDLIVSEKLHNAMKKKPMAIARSVEDLFYDNGVIIKELENEISFN